MYQDDEDTNYNQQQIGVLCWIVELGQINICAEVSMLVAFLATPRIGHLHAVLHVFLNSHDCSWIVLDPSYINHGEEPTGDWFPFYPDAMEELPADAPEPLGKGMQITCFVNADHAGDMITRHSHTTSITVQ